MKFAFGAVLAALGFADARRQANVKSLRNAIPVNADGSRRQLNQNQEFEITAYHSIIFSDCLSLKVIEEDMFDYEDGGQLQALAQEGSIVATKSYVLFNVVETQNAYYQKNADGNMYMLPLEDWLQGIGQQGEDEDEQYCQACEESEDYCNPNGNRMLTEDTKSSYEAFKHLMGRRRKLENGFWQITVDCDTCWDKGCYYEQQEQENNNACEQDAYYQGCTFDEEDVYQFVADGAACAETGIVEYNNNGEEMNINAGLMCNAWGTGVEMALFLNDECTIYDKSRSFSKTMEGTYVYAILSEAKSLIQEPFEEVIDCIQYEYVGIEDEYDQNNDNGDEEAPVNETCENLMNEALDLATCGGAEWNNDNNNNQNNDGQDISWYEYDVAEADDADEVCLKLQLDNGDYSSYRVYESSAKYGGGGNFFDYGSGAGSSGGGSAGKTIGIIIAVLVVVVAGVLIGQSFAKKSDSKKVPLVGNKAGAMA